MSDRLAAVDLRPYAITPTDKIIAEEYWLGESSEKRASEKAGIARHAVRVRLEVMRSRYALDSETALPQETRVRVQALGGTVQGVVLGRHYYDPFIGECTLEAQKRDWYLVQLTSGRKVSYLRTSLHVLA